MPVWLLLGHERGVVPRQSLQAAVTGMLRSLRVGVSGHQAALAGLEAPPPQTLAVDSSIPTSSHQSCHSRAPCARR
jgi:hypothetical protein